MKANKFLNLFISFLFLLAALFIPHQLVAAPVSGTFQGAVTSGEKTADAAITATGGYITGITVITDGTNDAKAIIYDNASAASGTVIEEITIMGSANFGGRNFVYPVQFTNGLYLDISGTGASCIIEYFNR
jgi:hypothetical protein